MFCDTFYVIYDTFYDILYDIFYVYLFRDLLMIQGSLSWLINLFLYFFIDLQNIHKIKNLKVNR